MSEKRTAGLVLRPEDAGSSEPHVFPGFPGRFVPGEAVAPGELGLTKGEATDLAEKLNLPLSPAMAKATDETQFERTGGIPSDSKVESFPPPTFSTDEAAALRSSVPGLTPAELAARDEYDAPREAVSRAAREGAFEPIFDVPTSPGVLSDAAVTPAVQVAEAVEAREEASPSGDETGS